MKQHDYIPAYKGQSRRLPMTDAFNTEAAQLQDAELDLRINTRFDRVFGNGLFEDAPPSPSNKANTPGHVKMNNLFDEPNRQNDQRNARRESPDRDSSDRQLAMSYRKHGSAGRNLAAAAPAGGTMVEAFDSRMEDSAMPVVARARTLQAGTSTQRNAAAWEAELKQLISSGRRNEAVSRVAPSEGMVRCYVRRVKNFFGTHCSFQMHLENGDVFLLAARRRKKSKVSSYVISQDLEDLRRDTDNCLAKLKANFVGTEYSLWAKGGSGAVKKGYGSEQLCINFNPTAFTTKGGPRAMFVVVPIPGADWSPSDAAASESLSNCLEMARRKELPPYLEKKLAMLSTKPPEYDESLKAFTLDFHGRVKEASVKNFQLVHWDHNTDRKGADIVLQFGKMEEDTYTLDFAYPLSVEAAFSIALASIDTKLCYTL
eukprot:CAMPEP_0202868270 /NCGR_PEP_ID=MMETSP1391-20130828/10614_1 /ASSEMBLY_ACC=CAM_ASM_000867 /TAXON_ID=1034604 /ORGANISM="Chlamydomonas leiostraca, Strain SAG 11-49" /LENGTH=428 /DNA_ID=CAMNT_0049548413 /DNA_START=313 /DNA_END=1599 /DNA_ORIENTATION=-